MNSKIRILDNFIISVCIFITLSPVYVWGREDIIFGGTLFVFVFLCKGCAKKNSCC